MQKPLLARALANRKKKPVTTDVHDSHFKQTFDYLSLYKPKKGTYAAR